MGQLLIAIARGGVTLIAANRMQLRRLTREDLCLAGFGAGVAVTLVPRGQQVVAVGRGELPGPVDY